MQEGNQSTKAPPEALLALSFTVATLCYKFLPQVDLDQLPLEQKAFVVLPPIGARILLYTGLHHYLDQRGAYRFIGRHSVPHLRWMKRQLPTAYVTLSNLTHRIPH